MRFIVDANIVFSVILNSNNKIGDLRINSKPYFNFPAVVGVVTNNLRFDKTNNQRLLLNKKSKFATNLHKMNTTAKRQKLVNYMKVADEKKVKAMYALFEDEIEQEAMEYSDEFKAELDSRLAYYKNGGKMINAEEADKQIDKILQPGKRK